MAALTQDRNTLRMGPSRSPNALPVLGGATIYNGALISTNSAGYAKGAADAVGEIVQGRAEHRVVNAGASGAENIRFIKGIFLFGNGGSFTIADVGKNCYVQDDQTVTTAALATNDILAGKIEGIDAAGVWVNVGL